MRYEWDDAKNEANRRKHGIAFRDAIPALIDPARVEWIDNRFDYGEERVCALGLATGNVLFVVHVLRDEETCRIISARRALKHEQERYFRGDP